MTYEVSADWIICKNTDGVWYNYSGGICSLREGEAAYCRSEGVYSRFKDGRFRVIRGKMFIDSLQRALETYDPSKVRVDWGGRVVGRDNGSEICCSYGYICLVKYGFIDPENLEYTGKRVTYKYLEFAFTNWSWIMLLFDKGRLQ